MGDSGFAVIGCTKCRRMMVADLSFARKKCQCGHGIDLVKVRKLAVCNSADEAGEVLRGVLAGRNSGFVTAKDMHEFSVAGKE